MRRFLEGANRIDGDHGNTHFIRDNDDRGDEHYVDGYGIADYGNGNDHVL
jgi:hypothetical protein